MILTDKEYSLITKHLKVVESAIRNSSASSIPAELRDGVVRILKDKGFKMCANCNHDLFISLCRVYDYYLGDKAERAQAEAAEEPVVTTTKKTSKKKSVQ